MSERLFHGVYSLLLTFFYLLIIIITLLKLPFRDASFRRRKCQRFGFSPTDKPLQTGGLLLHCVSMGEVVAASALVKRIRTQQPDYPITITTTTHTGADQVKAIFGDSVAHLFLPYDLRVCMKGLIQKVQPQKVLITEVELWPNMIDVCYQQDIPVYIINARLTEKSAKSYRKFSLLFNPMLQKINAVCAQGKRDLNNYRSMGIAEEKLFLSNNLKFDVALDPADVAKASDIKQQLQLPQRPILLGASTHDPEEEVLIQSYRKLKPLTQDLLLIITPRHPQRFDKVAKLLEDYKLSVVRLSENTAISESTDVVLADKMGVLKSLYSLANVAFVGGSIANRGGHNALEAALFAKPILMGPHTYNNPAICQTLTDSGALQIIFDADSLSNQVNQWLDNPHEAQTAGKAGRRVINENAGAIAKTLEIVGY